MMARSDKPLPGRPLGRSYAAVTVAVVNKKTLKVVPDSLTFLRSDAHVVPLPPTIRVVGTDGQAISPSGRFMLTSGSIDPYHGLIDYRD